MLAFTRSSLRRSTPEIRCFRNRKNHPNFDRYSLPASVPKDEFDRARCPYCTALESRDLPAETDRFHLRQQRCNHLICLGFIAAAELIEVIENVIQVIENFASFIP